jgi:hypothetical protein
LQLLNVAATPQTYYFPMQKARVNLLKIKDNLVGAAEAGMVEALGEPAGYGSGSVRLC